jgi:hypothetical protein
MSTNNPPDLVPPHPIPPSQPISPSTITLLDSLTAFYQQESAWVYRTRAALELAKYQTPVSGLSKNEPLPTPPPSATQTSEGLPTTPAMKRERTSPVPAPTSGTRWLERKKNFKLQLEGISTTNKRPVQRREASERLLVMFQNMLETRVESCQRVNQLVRNANRAALGGVPRRGRHKAQTG